MSEWRVLIDNRKTVASMTSTCPRCGEPCDREVYRGRRDQSWCKACHAAYMREYRRRTPLTVEQRRKDNARSYAGVYLRRGLITPGPCVGCGAADAEMHHHDYSKPLEVEWLCRRCHMIHHHDEKVRK